MPNLAASILLLIVQSVSITTLILYCVQYFRVRSRRYDQYVGLGEECVREIRKPPILMWFYILFITGIVITTTVYFLLLLPNRVL